MRNTLIVLVLTIFSFSGCQVGTSKGKTAKAPETRREKLMFYRAQIVSLESEIDYHLKHQIDHYLKSDYLRLEECLKGLSVLLDQEDQTNINEIIEVIHKTIENFNKTGSFLFFSRGNDKIFTALRKLKKKIQMDEKQKEQIEQKNKTEDSKKEVETKK